MPNPRANRPLTLDRVVEDLKSFSVPAQGLFDAMAGALRGSAVGTFGAPGDIETLGRMGLNAIGGSFNPAMPSRSGRAFQPVSEEPYFPSSEELAKRFPPTIPNGDPVRRKSAEPFEELGQFAPLPMSGKALKVLPYALGRGAGMATKEAARAINDAMVYQTGPLSQGPLSMLAPKGAVSHVVKPKGGNWLTDDVESKVGKMKMADFTPPEQLAETQRSIDAAKRIMGDDPDVQRTIRQMENELQVAKRNNAINQWVDRNLTNYIKNQMATPEDPVRRLAEEGITHKSDLGDYRTNPSRMVEQRRAQAGLPEEGMAQSDLAKQWENLTDISFMSRPAKNVSDSRYPWIAKLDPETPVYGGVKSDIARELGFDHIIDVLREDVATGRIRPEQLSKVSMEQAVRRTHEYDQELAAKMNADRAAKREGLPVHKEYPEGYRWVELNKPGAFASESEAMGHSVRGYEPPKGHPDWAEGSGESGSPGYGHGGWEAIKSGKAKVYSLVDPKGEPHVTVEVGASKTLTPEKRAAQIEFLMNRLRGEGMSEEQAMSQAVKLYPESETLSRITQIKGKGNAAPKEEYLPFVQDFVKGGQWSDVGDLSNAGLRDVKFMTNPDVYEKYLERGLTVPKYATEKELDELHNEYLRFAEPQNYKPPEGMKHGGSVHISDNPDTMMMELGDEHFALGGAALKMARANKARQAAQAAEKELALPPQLPRAKPRSKEELRPLAQEMAEATRGDFYRPEPSKSFNPAGKSFEQWKTEQGLVHDIRPTAKRQDIPRADIEKQKGMVKMGISGDTTAAEQVLHEAGPYALDIPSPQHGGALYGLGGEGAWASNNPIAANVQKRINEISQAYGDAPVLGQYMQMGKLGSDFALHFADANLRAIDLRGMSKDQIEMVNELIRKGSPKSGPRPSFPGIEDKDSAYLHFAVDPELRKHFNAIMQKPTYTEPLGLPDGRIIHHAITEPELRDLPVTTTGFSQMELAPGYDPEKLLLSEHPTYSHVIPNKPGTGLTRTQYHTPAQVEFPDVYEYLTETAPKKSRPQDMTRMYQTSTPRQIIDQQHIDEIKMFEELMKEYGGKKEGGAITVKPKKDGQKFKPGKKPDQILKHGQAMPRGKDPEVDINQIVPQMSAGGKLSKVALEAIQRMKAMRPEIAAKSSLEQKALAENTAKYARDIQPFSMTDEEVAAEIKRLESKGMADGGEVNADDLILEERRL